MSENMHHSSPYREGASISAAMRPDRLQVVAEFEGIMGQFYSDMAQVNLENYREGSLAVEAACLDPDALLVMAMRALEGCLFGDGEYSGINYSDIGGLIRNPSVRETLYAGDAYYRPVQTNVPLLTNPTQTYQMNVLQDNLVHIIEEQFGQEAMRDPNMSAQAEAAVWRVLMALVIQIADAVHVVARNCGISPAQLQTYRFNGGDKLGLAPYAYVLYLTH